MNVEDRGYPDLFLSFPAENRLFGPYKLEQDLQLVPAPFENSTLALTESCIVSKKILIKQGEQNSNG
jgi:hypothetical protein